MTQQEAIAYLTSRRNTKIAALYDEDDTAVDALQTVLPEFEYPAHDQKTCGQFLKQYA